MDSNMLKLNSSSLTLNLLVCNLIPPCSAKTDNLHPVISGLFLEDKVTLPVFEIKPGHVLISLFFTALVPRVE